MSTTAPLHQAVPRDDVVTQVRKRPFGLVVALLFVAFIGLMVWTSRPEDTTPLSTNNSTEEGTRALAQILRGQGVEVRQVATMSAARIADPAATTLVIADNDSMMDYQLESIADYPGDLVLIAPGQMLLDALETELSVGYSLDTSPTAAGCDDPDAQAAGEIEVLGSSVAGDPVGALTCFTNSSGEHGYVVIDDGGRRITLLPAWLTVTNAHLAERGHAALGLRAVGRHETVVWYVADMFDPTSLTWNGSGTDGAAPPSEIEANPDFLPPGTGPMLFVLGLAVAVAAVWRARRFGPLVTEPLPVVVRASESTRGRARLYRRAQASGRAGAAMRARAATRMGRRLGVPRAADRDALVAAVARASSRNPRDVDALLYGPHPSDGAAFMTLVDQLDTLEREVHRP
ncbi:DUF4350 domain-containing protein [Demequina sp.]|uniref:DUF4350 domain-containing protein n=1 Tax=Demequina sp. TaxID=2050685 RepID=UPI003A86501B